MKHHKAMYTQYCPVHQTKMSANVLYVLICQSLQTYCVYGSVVHTFVLHHLVLTFVLYTDHRFYAY